MTDNIWTSYAERRPTKEDADEGGFVLLYSDSDRLWVGKWQHSQPPGWSWARTADVLRATGYVKPRKLHSAWKEPKDAKWEGYKRVWGLVQDEVRLLDLCYAHEAAACRAWQPCDPPPVWGDE